MRADLSLSIDRLAVAVFGKRTAAVGVPMRTLQERISQRDYKNKTTLTYADYAPLAHERKLVERAFGGGATIGDAIDNAKTASRR